VGAAGRIRRRHRRRAIPCFVATWALGGLYLSLGPSLAAAATGSPNLLWGGLVIFLVCGTAVATGILLFRPGGKPARSAPASRRAMPPGPCPGPPCPQAMGSGER
jgi:hypothetical protein